MNEIMNKLYKKAINTCTKKDIEDKNCGCRIETKANISNGVPVISGGLVCYKELSINNHPEST